MKEERQLDLDGDIKLSFKVFELLLLFGEVKAVVIKSYFAEGDRVACILRVDREGLELLKKSRRAALVGIKRLRRAGMNTDSCVTEPSCIRASSAFAILKAPRLHNLG